MDNRNGFTLIELLVVIAIIGILAGMLSTGVERARRKAYITEAQAMVSTLEMAISMYKTDTGALPQDDGAGLTTCVALVNALQDASGNGPYMQFKPSELSGGSVIDSWGRTYRYIANNGGGDTSLPTNNIATYDLWSEGPTTNSGDEVVNW